MAQDLDYGCRRKVERKVCKVTVPSMIPCFRRALKIWMRKKASIISAYSENYWHGYDTNFNVGFSSKEKMTKFLYEV